jgi:hypothetical protein
MSLVHKDLRRHLIPTRKRETAEGPAAQEKGLYVLMRRIFVKGEGRIRTCFVRDRARRGAKK